MIAVLIAGALAATPARAHATTTCGAGCIVANEDDYPAVGAPPITFNPNGPTTLSVDAAHGLLANDNGNPLTTKVDLPDTVDDYTSNHHLLTTDNGFTVMLNGDGSFTYSTDGTFSGIDSFTYYILDTSDSTLSDFNTVTITISPLIKPITFNGSGVIDEPEPGVLGNDAGIDPNTLTIDSTSANGGTIDDNGFGAFTYTPPAGPHPAVDTFNYDVLDTDDDNDYPGTVTITSDGIPPTVAMSAPTASVLLSPTITVKWSGSDTGGSGFSHFDVQVQGNTSTGTWGTWSNFKMNTTATSATYNGTYGRSYTFRVRSVDNAGNTSPWVWRRTSIPFRAGAFSYSSGWHSTTYSGYFGGGAFYTTTQNATASRSGVYAKHISLVATEESNAGTVQILWNGVVKANINLFRATTAHHVVVAALSFPSVQKGTLTVKVTSTSKYVVLEGLDAFIS